MSCSGCPLDGVATPFLEGGGADSKVMIIIDSPSYYETSMGTPYVSPNLKQLYNELIFVGIDISTCYITYGYKCYKDEIKSSDLKICRHHLEEEIDRVKPKYILILGAIAYKSLGFNGSLEKHRGRVFQYKDSSCIVTYKVSSVIHKPELLTVFRADLYYFSRIVSNIKGDLSDFHYVVVTTPTQLETMYKEVSRCKYKSYDIETNSLNDTDKGKILMIGIYTEKGGYIIPIESEYCILESTAPIRTVLNDLLKHHKGEVNIAQNGKFDNRWLKTRYIYAYNDFDTYLASYLLNVNLPHDLKYMAKVECGAMDYADGVEYTEDYDFESMAKYCALDCYYTYKLYFILRARIVADKGLLNVFRYIIMPGSHTLADMEFNGAYIDYKRLLSTIEVYKEKVIKLNLGLKDSIGDTNISSPKQLQKLLYTDLKLPLQYVIDKKTKKKSITTNKAALRNLTDYSDIPKQILEYRGAEKALNTFLVPWKEYLDVETKYGRPTRLHPTYNIAITATGRLSCNNPNLQQVSRDVEIRSLITAPEGRDLLEYDMSQLELRVGAFVADEPTMKQLYREGKDLHKKTASAVARCREEDVTKQMRTSAKAVNFGYIYGMGWRGFRDYAKQSYNATFTDDEAKEARNTYFRLYSRLTAWHNEQRAKVRRLKGIFTATGRFRHLPNIDSPDSDLRGEAERQAINTPVQSLGSDIVMLGIIELDRILKLKYPSAMLVLQVHDAVSIECDHKDTPEIGKITKYCMEVYTVKTLKEKFGIDFDVPLVVEGEVGAWGKGTEIKA